MAKKKNRKIPWSLLRRQRADEAKKLREEKIKSIKVDESLLEMGVTPDAGTRTINNEWIRVLAETQYVTSQVGLSVPELHRMEPFCRMSLVTIERWCAEDGWLAKRVQYFAQIKDRIEEQLATSIVRTRVKQLEMVDALILEAEKTINSKDLAANSKEGMISSFCKLMDLSDRLREKVAEKIIPKNLEVVREYSGMQIEPVLTDEEARAAALAILKQRRERMLASQVQPSRAHLSVVESAAQAVQEKLDGK